METQSYFKQNARYDVRIKMAYMWRKKIWEPKGGEKNLDVNYQAVSNKQK